MPALEVKTTAARKRRPLRWWLLRGSVVVIGLVLLWRFYGEEESNGPSGTTFAARRGPLRITVLEGGTIEALESQEIKSEVKGETKILAIVDEGYMVTDEDVANGKILVELDATELVERQISQELAYQNALAAYTDASESFEIQMNQNMSDITTAELAVKFARMDFEKFMGAELAGRILAELDIHEELLAPFSLEEELESRLNERMLQLNEQARTNSLSSETLDAMESDAEPGAGAEGEGNGTEATPAATPQPVPGPAEPTAEAVEVPSDIVEHKTIDFAQYTDSAVLGDGEAGQKLRALEDSNVLSDQELALAKTSLEGKERLAEKEFVTKNELDTEKLKVRRNEIALQSAVVDKDLYIHYEFPKQAEKLLSEYEEAIRKLERARKMAVSKLAQARAKLKSEEAQYILQTKKKQDIEDQISKCKIKAERPGLVVYGSGESEYYRGETRVEEGASVRERQQIITIPDMKEMSVKVKIHESAIKNVQKDQTATIRVDAYPDEVLTGRVVKVGVLPDSRNRWMNPDVKVYETVVAINGVHGWMKPGMSAQVEILVRELPDVVHIPIQAIYPRDDQRIVYMASLTGTQPRVVETGAYNNEFIEITSGLKEGEEVMLRAPISVESAASGKAEAQNGNGAPKKDGPAEDTDAGSAPPSEGPAASDNTAGEGSRVSPRENGEGAAPAAEGRSARSGEGGGKERRQRPRGGDAAGQGAPAAPAPPGGGS